MISFEYGWIKSGEVIVEASKAKGVDGIKLILAIKFALKLSEDPKLAEMQASGNPRFDEGMSSEDFVRMTTRFDADL